jgi:hypothetical protein
MSRLCEEMAAPLENGTEREIPVRVSEESVAGSFFKPFRADSSDALAVVCEFRRLKVTGVDIRPSHLLAAAARYLGIVDPVVSETKKPSLHAVMREAADKLQMTGHYIEELKVVETPRAATEPGGVDVQEIRTTHPHHGDATQVLRI